MACTSTSCPVVNMLVPEWGIHFDKTLKILTCLHDSPFKRNDWIVAVDGIPVTCQLEYVVVLNHLLVMNRQRRSIPIVVERDDTRHARLDVPITSVKVITAVHSPYMCRPMFPDQQFWLIVLCLCVVVIILFGPIAVCCTLAGVLVTTVCWDQKRQVEQFIRSMSTTVTPLPPVCKPMN